MTNKKRFLIFNVHVETFLSKGKVFEYCSCLVAYGTIASCRLAGWLFPASLRDMRATGITQDKRQKLSKYGS